MKKKGKRNKAKVIISKTVLNRFVPLDVEEFKFLMTEIYLSMKGSMPSNCAPSDFKFAISNDNNPEISKVYSFADNQFNRAMMRIKKHFGDERREEAFSAMGRFMALGELLNFKELIDCGLIKDTDNEGGLSISSAVVELAATEPIDNDLNFNQPDFLSKALELHKNQLESEK